MKLFLTFVLVLNGLWNYSQAQYTPINHHQNDSSKTTLSTKLTIPFGTIAKLEVEIYDGDSLQIKAYQGTYLLKINSVDGKQQIDTLLMTFEDETDGLANNNFRLFKLIYGRKTNSISGKQIDQMKKNYVGKKLTLMAYESGRFIGMPKDYFKYRPIVAGREFHFENYLVIVSGSTR